MAAEARVTSSEFERCSSCAVYVDLCISLERQVQPTYVYHLLATRERGLLTVSQLTSLIRGSPCQVALLPLPRRYLTAARGSQSDDGRLKAGCRRPDLFNYDGGSFSLGQTRASLSSLSWLALP